MEENEETDIESVLIQGEELSQKEIVSRRKQ